MGAGVSGVWSVLDRGQFGLIVGPADDEVAKAAAHDRGADVTSVAQEVLPTSGEMPDPHRALRRHSVLADLDVLFWPDVKIDPIRLLQALAREAPLVAIWPGVILRDRATYSEPGRRDYYNQRLPREAVVLRAHGSTFPDEPPYDVERI